MLKEAFRIIAIIFPMVYCVDNAEAQNNREYFFFGEVYVLELNDKILRADESVLINKDDSVRMLEIIDKARSALKFDVPKGYSNEASRVGATRFVDGGGNPVWLWEVVFSPKFSVEGEGVTGAVPGEISVFVTRSGLIIVPTKRDRK